MAFGSLLAGAERAPAETIQIGGRLTGERVLVPILTNEEPSVADQIRVAFTITRATGGEVRFVDPIGAEEASRTFGTPIPDDAPEEALTWSLKRLAGSRSHRVGGLLSGRRAAGRVHDRVRADGHDTLVLPRSTANGPLAGRRLERLARNVPCNVISVNGDAKFEEVASVLLPIANGPHSGLATDVAAAIATQDDSYIDVLHVISPDADASERDAAESRAAAAVERTGLPETANTWILEAEDPTEAIVEQSAYYGLTVIGAPTAGRLHRFVYGSRSQSIRNDAESVVIAARAPSTSL